MNEGGVGDNLIFIEFFPLAHIQRNGEIHFEYKTFFFVLMKKTNNVDQMLKLDRFSNAQERLINIRKVSFLSIIKKKCFSSSKHFILAFLNPIVILRMFPISADRWVNR